MIAAIWHATPPSRTDGEVYRLLFQGARDNFDMPVVHLTTRGHPCWGDWSVEFDLDPENIVLNREIAFRDFLASQDGPVWFTEPDARLYGPLPDIEEDAALIYRPKDKVPMCPAFRIAKPSALPLFEEFAEEMEGQNAKWDGDSEAFTRVWHRMGGPGLGVYSYKGMSVRMLPYSEFVDRFSSGTCKNYKAKSKIQLLRSETSYRRSTAIN